MARWIEKIWFDKHPLAYLAAPLLWPLSKLFATIVAFRRRYFLAHPHLSYKAPVPVVVVGNISVGGNGKTPLVIWLVEQLRARGFHPGVVSRGYGGNAKIYPLVLNETSVPDEVGDEPVLIFKRTQCPISVSPKRQEAIEALLPLGIDIIISDDGLQHYQMARDLELVVVDGKRRFGNRHYLPMGPLREGIARLEHVNRVICNGGLAHENEMQMQLVPRHLVNLQTGESILVEQLKTAVAMAGIGSPARFFNTLEQLGIYPEAYIAFPDHQAFDLNSLLALTPNGEQLLMTEKDAVKCRELIKDKQVITHWWYLPVDASFDEKEALDLLELIVSLKEKNNGSPSFGNRGMPFV